jgi:hypothetical protein
MTAGVTTVVGATTAAGGTTSTGTTTGLLGPRTISLRTRVLLYLPVVVLTLVALWVAEERPYTAGSDFGYYLGLVGSCMMLSLFLYPLRKHVRILQKIGSMRGWFIAHMIFGICGPVLVLFHSTFQTQSLNATVAFWAMIIVTTSGILGRFVFTGMYVGLEGKKATLREMEMFLNKCSDEARHAFDLVPDVKSSLEEYRSNTMAARTFTWGKILNFLAIGWQGERLIAKARKQVLPMLRREARLKNWTRSKYLAEKKMFHELIEDYVNAIDMTARYTYWENLLAWWQLAHVPLAYVLLITAIVHVIAVHMY